MQSLDQLTALNKFILLIKSRLTDNIEHFWCYLLSNSETLRNLAQILQSIATTIAIIAGLWWFFQRRQVNPRAKISHKIIHKELDKDTLLVRVTATLENIGNVLIEIDEVEARIQWVSPLTEDVEEYIKEAEKCKRLLINFPEIDTKTVPYEKDEEIIIEPGESQEIYCDFILDSRKYSHLKELTTVIIYCYIRNIKYRSRDFGWYFEEMYDLSEQSKLND